MSLPQNITNSWLSTAKVLEADYQSALDRIFNGNSGQALTALDDMLSNQKLCTASSVVGASRVLAVYGWALLHDRGFSEFSEFIKRIPDDELELCPELHTLALIHEIYTGGCQKVEDKCNSFLRVIEESVRVDTALYLFCRGVARHFLGRNLEAIQDLEIAHSLFCIWEEDLYRGKTSNYIGLAYINVSDFYEARKWFRRAIEVYEERGWRRPLAMALSNIGIPYYKVGDFKTSIQNIKRSLEIVEEGGWKRRQLFTNLALGKVYRFLRDYKSARRHLHASYGEAQSMGFRRAEALALEFIGDIYLEEGLATDAYRFYVRARAIANEIAPRGDITMEVHRRIGECHLLAGNTEEALNELRAGLKLAREQFDRYAEAVILRVIAEVSRSIGDLERAKRNIRNSTEILEEIGARHELAVSQLLQIEVLVAELEQGRDASPGKTLDCAWALSRSALDIFLASGIRFWIDKARLAAQRVSGLRSDRDDEVAKDGRKFSQDTTSQPVLIIHSSRVMRDLLQLCDMYAATRETVLITGETGTGKELIAKRIHDVSARSQAQLVPVNVSAIPASLFEREFFGHAKGAYSGAESAGLGFAGRADGGTLFLDEIGDLPLEIQPKLLRLLQDGTYNALGDPATRKADLRLVAATNADLGRLVQEGRFRSDLYYRLKILELELPPLRERREDILLLLRHFLSDSVGRPVDLSHYFDQPSLERIQTYTWPGNVREIVMVARRAAVELEAKGSVRVELVGAGDRIELVGPKPRTLAALAGETNGALITSDSAGIHAVSASVERSRILLALEESGGSKVVAAQRLGMSRSTLYRKMRRLEILSKED